jgi:hypothetical protein
MCVKRFFFSGVNQFIRDEGKLEGVKGYRRDVNSDGGRMKKGKSLLKVN